MGPQGRIRIAAGRIGRGDHELKTLCISRRRADVDIHISAADPLCVRSHTDLIGTIIAEHSADRMCAMAVVIARRDSVWPAGTAARVDSIVPVIVVVRR